MTFTKESNFEDALLEYLPQLVLNSLYITPRTATRSCSLCSGF